MPFFTRARSGPVLQGDLIPAEAPRGVTFRNPLFAADARIIEAEFVEIGPAAPGDFCRPPMTDRPLTAPSRRASRTFVVASAGPAFAARLTGGWAFGALVAVLAAASFWLAGGHALAGKPARAPGAIAIEHVESRIVEANGRRILVVEGAVANHGRQAAAVPRMAVTAAGAAHAIEPSGSVLAPGQRQAFHGRFLAPDGAGWTVAVSFF